MTDTRSRRFPKLARRIGQGSLALVAGFTMFLLFRSPSHDRDWAQSQAVLPSIAFDGPRATVRNVRNFRYDAAGAVTDPGYDDRTYDLSQLTTVWYGIAHFSSFDGLAHSFLSFEFADGQYLALSIEARREAGVSYNPFFGLFRAYEIIYILADERDVIGLRSHIEGNRVLLYPLQLAPEEGAVLLRTLLQEADEIIRSPRFYNTLTDNCITGITDHAKRVSAWRRMFDYRILLPGFSDGLALDIGALWPGIPLEEARRRATIDPDSGPIESERFSVLIRQAMRDRGS